MGHSLTVSVVLGYFQSARLAAGCSGPAREPIILWVELGVPFEVSFHCVVRTASWKLLSLPLYCLSSHTRVSGSLQSHHAHKLVSALKHVTKILLPYLRLSSLTHTHTPRTRSCLHVFLLLLCTATFQICSSKSADYVIMSSICFEDLL